MACQRFGSDYEVDAGASEIEPTVIRCPHECPEVIRITSEFDHFLYRVSIWCQFRDMDYEIDARRFLAWHATLIGYGKDWLTQCLDNVTEWQFMQFQACVCLLFVVALRHSNSISVIPWQ